ncbi:hypothetical protein J1D01_10435 [Seonamhaeicola sp. NFXS20]|uniref:DUF6515 family protein n=1 Tax=unclassified Seonamhaeicola TaxID=2622645 RepID=UPI003567154E
MKTLIKTYVLPAFLIFAFTATSAEAQGRRTSSNTKVVTTKSKILRRVPSSKVTYKKPTRKVVAVRNLPNKTIIKHKGQNYYYSNNRFYTNARGRYIAIPPKIGFRVNVLPQNFKRIRFNNHLYFLANGIFYIQVNNVYEVVEPEVGTIVYELPDDSEKVTIDGLTYYEYANVLYEKVQVDGTRAYEVVGFIEME